MKISAIFEDNSEQVFIEESVPTFPTFARVKHWHERFGLSYLAYARWESGNPRLHAGSYGDPAVFQLNCSSSDHPVHMTPEIENWALGLLRQSSKGTMTEDKLKLAYRNLYEGMKAFTNGFGWDDGYQSVILNLNMGKEAQKLQLTMANGATIKILGRIQRRGGQLVYPFEVMNAQDPNTLKRTLKDSWWLMFPATNSTLEPQPKGTVEPFPKLNDYDLIVPMLANNTNVGYIQAEWVEFLGNNITQPVFPYYKTWVSEEQWKMNRGLF